MENRIDINQIFSDLESAISVLNQIEAPKTSFALEWTGVIGAVQDSIRNKRVNKLFNTPIINDTNYLNVGGFMIKCAKEVAEYCKENTDNTETICIKTVGLIGDCYKSWERVYPALMSYGVEDDPEIGQNLTMGVTVRFQLYKIFASYTLPKEMEEENILNLKVLKRSIDNNKTTSNSGCLSIIALLIGIPSLLLYIIA